MTESDVLLVRSTDNVCRFILNRPEKLNALNGELLERILEAQQRVAKDGNVHVVLLSGAGRAFCAGADLDHISAVYRDPDQARQYLEILRDVVVGFEQLPQVVVTAVHGVVLAGGLELMLGSDIVLAARSTQIGDQHTRRDFIPGGGNTQRIPRWVARAHARDLLFTGRWLSADEAHAIGLVSRVSDDATLEAEAAGLADDLAHRSYRALRDVKRLANAAETLPLAEGLALEIQAVMEYYEAPEFAAGLEGFLKRPRST